MNKVKIFIFSFFFLFDIVVASGSPILPSGCRVDELAPLLEVAAAPLFEKGFYDRTVYFMETSAKPGECDDCVRFDSKDLVRRYGSANCVGITDAFKEKVSSIVPLESVLATLPPHMRQPRLPEYSHVALVARCEDGTLLLDLSLNISKPIVLKNEGDTVEQDLGWRGVWKFTLNQAENRINVKIFSAHLPHRLGHGETFHYILNSAEGLDEKISTVYFKYDQKILIFAFAFPNQTFRRMSLNFSKEPWQIEYTSLEPDGGMKRHFAFPFFEYYKDPSSLERVITEQVADELRIPRKDLLVRLREVMNRVKPERSILLPE